MMHRGSPQRRTAGLTLVELLVVIGIMAVVMTVVGSFFASQARVSTGLQEEGELQLRLRSVAEAMTQDLTLAGARAIASNGTVQYVPEVDTICGSVYVQCSDTTLLTTIYASSLRLTYGAIDDACRWVTYVLTDGTLYRGDTRCEDGGDGAASFGSTFATGIDAIDVAFTCVESDASGGPVTQADPTSCSEGIRAATVTVTGTSLGRSGTSDTLSLSVSMPNTRTVGGGS